MPHDFVAPTCEYSIFLRFVTDGRPGPVTRKFFLNAQAALAFLQRLEATNTPAITTLASREVGSWNNLALGALEAAAAEEAGRL